MRLLLIHYPELRELVSFLPENSVDLINNDFHVFKMINNIRFRNINLELRIKVLDAYNMLDPMYLYQSKL